MQGIFYRCNINQYIKQTVETGFTQQTQVWVWELQDVEEDVCTQ